MSVLGRFAGDNAPRAVFPSLFDKPMMLGIMAVLDKKDSYSLFPGQAGIACDNAPRAVFSSLVHKPLMLGIMADMNQQLDFLGDAFDEFLYSALRLVR